MRFLIPFAVLCAASPLAHSGEVVAIYEFSNSVESTDISRTSEASSVDSPHFPAYLAYSAGEGRPAPSLCLDPQVFNTVGHPGSRNRDYLSFIVTPDCHKLDFEVLCLDTSALIDSNATCVTLAIEVDGQSKVVDMIEFNSPDTNPRETCFDLAWETCLQNVCEPVTFTLYFFRMSSSAGGPDVKVDNIRVVADADPLGPALDANSGNEPSLPVVTSECFSLTGDCLDQTTGVMLDGQPISDNPGDFGDGFYEIVNPNELRICPPQCVSPGRLEVKVAGPAGVNNADVAFVNLERSREPQIGCLEIQDVYAPQRLFMSAGDTPQPNILTWAISPSNQPSLLPGVIELGIGGSFTSLLCLHAGSGDCVELVVPAFGPLAHTVKLYYQGIIVDLSAGFPARTTPVCEVTYSLIPPANFVADGGFESPPVPTGNGRTDYQFGDFIGGAWEVMQGSVDVHQRDNNENGIGGASDEQLLDLHGSDPGAVSQELSGLIPGNVYELSFRYAVNTGSTEATARVDVADLSQTWTADNVGSYVWRIANYTFTAQARTATLTFTGLSSDGPSWSGMLIDAVVVTKQSTP